MRKKSHISLAKGIIHGLDMHDRITHRVSFYIGSIWPDCTPSFLTKRHCIEDTYDVFMKKIRKFIIKFNHEKDMGILSTLRMGIITHYVADYFTYPHNSHYQGGFKEHCIYEEELKRCMYKYVDGVRSDEPACLVPVMKNLRQLSDFIKEKHEEYKNIQGNCYSDCDYSYMACISVVASVLNMAVKNSSKTLAIA